MFLTLSKKLREDNINLLKHIFFREEPTFEEQFQKFFSRAFLMNYEFMQVYLERERKIHQQLQQKLAIKDEEIHSLIEQHHKLEKVPNTINPIYKTPLETLQNQREF